MDAISSATAGITAAYNRLGAVAATVSSGTGDLASAAVDEVSAKTQLQANVAVLKSAEQMNGALLDLFV